MQNSTAYLKFKTNMSKLLLINLIDICLNEQIQTVIIETNEEIKNYEFIGLERVDLNIYKLII